MSSQLRCHTWLLDIRCWKLIPNVRDWTRFPSCNILRKIGDVGCGALPGNDQWQAKVMRPWGRRSVTRPKDAAAASCSPFISADAMSMCDRVKVKHWGRDVVGGVSGARVDSCVSRCFLSQCPCVARLWGSRTPAARCAFCASMHVCLPLVVCRLIYVPCCIVEVFVL